MSETPDLLRIIAGEPERLSQQDRESIRLAASELELSERNVRYFSDSIAELHQQIAALMERNGELQHRVTDLECQTASDRVKLEGYYAKEDTRQSGPLDPSRPMSLSFRAVCDLTGWPVSK